MRSMPMFIIWLALRAGKMKRVLYSDWLPERARWAYLACSGLPALIRKSEIFGHIRNPVLTKLVWSRWLVIGLVLFLSLYGSDRGEVEVHKNA